MDEVQRNDTGTNGHHDKHDSFSMVDRIEDTKGVISDDVGMKVYGDAEHCEFTERENKQVLRKIDFILLPLLCACYMFSVRGRCKYSYKK